MMAASVARIAVVLAGLVFVLSQGAPSPQQHDDDDGKDDNTKDNAYD